MTVNTVVYKNIADLSLWFKSKSGDQLSMADVPELISLRWQFIKNNWNEMRLDLLNKLDQFDNPSILKDQIENFDSFVEVQRNSTVVANPLSSSDIFYKYYLMWDALPVEVAPITPVEQGIIDAAVERVNLFSKNNFVSIRNSVIEERDRMVDTVGGSDDEYNAIYNRSSLPSYTTPTIPDINQMMMYQNVIASVDFILANIFSIDTVFVDPFALAKTNANNPDIDIKTYSTGSLVKFNYGEDLKALALKYFGDPDKWIDIAIANGLKPPYIDEVGEKLDLLSNGEGNQINIAKLDSNGAPNVDKFYINQPVILQSDTQVFPEQRIVISIKEVPISGELVIELSGENDLDRYKIAEDANVRIYKPNTINSQFFILIPSDEPLDQTPGETPWFLRTSGEDEKRAKVDLALDSNGDLSFNASGDFQLSYGLANAIQAIKLKILIEQGSLQRHPEFGLIAVQGTRNIDIDFAKNLIVQSLTAQIEADARFDRIESLDVEYFGNGSAGGVGYLISLVVRLAGGGKTIPISFTVNIS